MRRGWLFWFVTDKTVYRHILQMGQYTLSSAEPFFRTQDGGLLPSFNHSITVLSVISSFWHHAISTDKDCERSMTALAVRWTVTTEGSGLPVIERSEKGWGNGISLAQGSRQRVCINLLCAITMFYDPIVHIKLQCPTGYVSCWFSINRHYP